MTVEYDTCPSYVYQMSMVYVSRHNKVYFIWHRCFLPINWPVRQYYFYRFFSFKFRDKCSPNFPCSIYTNVAELGGKIIKLATLPAERRERGKHENRNVCKHTQTLQDPQALANGNFQHRHCHECSHRERGPKRRQRSTETLMFLIQGIMQNPQSQ